jgi:TfoX/Sxy family transcriptional regulator of competence genes
MNDSSQILDLLAAELLPEWNIGTARRIAAGNWFGKPCLRVDGKVFAVHREGSLALKLPEEDRARARQAYGARPFDPRGKGHPLKEWVQLPPQEFDTWVRFARLACEYVAGAAQAEKDALIGGLIEARKGLLDRVKLLSPAQQDQVFLGEWTVKELLAHLVGWDHTNLEAVGEILAGEKPAFWQQYDRDWQSYNARLVAQHRRDDFAEMLAAVEQSHRALIEYLQAVHADQYAKRKPIKTLLRAETTDEEEHRQQVEEFRTGGGT